MVGWGGVGFGGADMSSRPGAENPKSGSGKKLQWMKVASNGDGTRARLGATLTGGINK